MKFRHVHMILGLAVMLAIGCKGRMSMPDMSETYGRKDSRPFGGQIAWRLLQHAYPSVRIEENRKPFAQAYQKTLKDSNSLYVCISNQFLSEDEDVSAILDYVYDGNTFFLSSAKMDSSLLNKIYCSVSQRSFSELPFPINFQDASLTVVEGEEEGQGKYGYYYLPFSAHFTEINDHYCRILGYNQDKEPNAIVFFWGKGKMILHTAPRAFSNYFLLTGNNRQYWLDYLQLLERHPDQVIWDTHYQNKKRKRSDQDFSSFSEIMKHPPLATAFWIVLAMLSIYILFGAKRKQRIIREITPNTNSSVAFTETIARLYLQKKDNKNIADKMIMYFNEFIRTHYFLPVNPGSKEFVQALSRKSGVPLIQAESLFNAIHQVSEQSEVSDFELLSLNEQIQQFYKNRK